MASSAALHLSPLPALGDSGLEARPPGDWPVCHYSLALSPCATEARTRALSEPGFPQEEGEDGARVLPDLRASSRGSPEKGTRLGAFTGPCRLRVEHESLPARVFG